MITEIKAYTHVRFAVTTAGAVMMWALLEDTRDPFSHCTLFRPFFQSLQMPFAGCGQPTLMEISKSNFFTVGGVANRKC